MPEVTSISLSSVRSYQRCQQLYAYRYIDHIQRRGRSQALDIGSIVHDYLDRYYTALKAGKKAAEAHSSASWEVSTEWTPKLKRYSQIAFAAGDTEGAKEIADLIRKTGSLITRYHKARGAEDARRHKVLLVEQRLDNHLTKTVRTRGYADLVTQDRETGRVHLWEHKTTKNVPAVSTKLRDLQTLLYGEQLARFYDTPVDSVIWNYVRTKEPSVPEVLKSSKVPALTKRADLDSTWEIYEQAAKEAGVDLDGSYDQMRERLVGRELTIFFPRWEQVTVANSTVMLRDYLRTGLEIRRFERRVAEGIVAPIRSLDQACDYCEYNMLCQAAITGGDTEDLVRMKYEPTERREQRNASNQDL